MNTSAVKFAYLLLILWIDRCASLFSYGSGSTLTGDDVAAGPIYIPYSIFGSNRVYVSATFANIA